jgi:hypothetical protein
MILLITFMKSWVEAEALTMWIYGLLKDLKDKLVPKPKA